MSPRFWSRIVGPRVPESERTRNRGLYRLPTLLFLAAALLLLVSLVTPYWRMTLHAPQYPGGLHLRARLTHLTGDVREIDGLNHYIGMRPLEEAASLERSLSGMAIGVLALLIVAAIWIHTRWAALLALPAVLFPAGFLLDLYLWMRHFGLNLDPRAPLSSSVKPFVPPVLGEGFVGQFRTVALPDIGLILATLASALIVVGLWAHRRAYKPLVDSAASSASARTPGTPAGLVAFLLLPLGAGLTGASTAAAEGSTLQARIDAAAAGSVLVVPAGTYSGPIRIDHPLTLEGEPGAVIEGSGHGDVIVIDAPDVTLRGLHIRGTGISLDRENAAVTVLGERSTVEDCVIEDALFGIYLKKAQGGTIRRNRILGKSLELARRGDAIRLWYSDDSVVEDNVVIDGRDVVIWFSSRVRISGNTVRSGRYGLHFMYSDDVLVEDNHMEDNSVGGFLMYSRNLRLYRNTFLRSRGPSGYGIGLKDMDGVVAEENRILGNRIGIYLDNSPWSVDVFDDFRRNVIAYNDIGVAFQPAVRRNRFVENTFLENQEQVAVLGAGDFHGNEFTIGGRGNFWSDYEGYDADGDGIGDLPYRAESLFESMMDRDKRLRLFLYGPAQQAIELAARALPAIRPRPKLTDTAPLSRPVPIAADPVSRSSSAPMTAAGVALLLGSAVILGAVRPHSGAEPPAAGPADIPSHPSKSEGPALRVDRLTKAFGRVRAVDDVSFDLAAGESVALWGHNGAGKTTAIRCILGLLPFRGSVAIDGVDLMRDGRAARRRLGYVPQELALHDDLRTAETLVFYARLKKVPRSRVAATLEEVGLASHAAKRVRELSGGMKQRLALGVALLADPPVMLLDEMTSNLDADARGTFIELLARQHARGKTLLFTSHRLDEVHALADRVLLLDQGRLVASCRPQELAATAGLRTRLHLLVPADSREEAARVLAELDLSPRHDGPYLSVRVRADTKLDVIRRLEQRGIPIRDFHAEGEIPADANGAPDQAALTTIIRENP